MFSCYWQNHKELVQVNQSNNRLLKLYRRQKKIDSLVLSVVPLSVEIIFREGGLSERGWKRDKRGLGTRGNPRRVEHWRSRSINRLRLVTDSRSRDQARARGVWRGVGL